MKSAVLSFKIDQMDGENLLNKETGQEKPHCSLWIYDSGWLIFYI